MTDQRSRVRALGFALATTMLCMLIASCDDSKKKTQQTNQDNFSDSVHGDATPPPQAKAEPPKPPHLSFSPPSVDFRLRPGVSRQVPVIVTNDGTRPVPTANIKASVQPPFAIKGDCGAQPSLLPNAKCSLTISITDPGPGDYRANIDVEGTVPEAILAITANVEAPPPPPTPVDNSTADIIRASMTEAYNAQVQAAPPKPAGTIARTQPSAASNGWTPTLASLPVTDLGRTVLRYTPIAATIENAVDSELGCLVTAIVNEDVFSHRRMNRPIIPKGSRLEGNCTQVEQDQQRLAIIWTRIVTIDDRVVNLSAPSLDNIGRTGIPATVHDPFWINLGKAMLISVVTNVGAASIPGNSSSTTVDPAFGSTTTVTTPRQQAIQNITNDASNATAQALLHESKIDRLTLLLPQGQPIIVYPTNDITFPVELVLPPGTATNLGLPVSADDPNHIVAAASDIPGPNGRPYLDQPAHGYGALVYPGYQEPTATSAQSTTAPSTAQRFHPSPGITITTPAGSASPFPSAQSQ
jgi:type IV secretory pathway VirB10-like protein